MKLCKLILRYKDTNDKEKHKEVEFYDSVTLITGSSKKGKSAIIELVDYVLFSSTNIIPAGLIKDHLKVAILQIELDGEVISLIRETQTDKMQLVVGEITKDTRINDNKYTSKDSIQIELEKKLNLHTTDYIKENFSEKDSPKKTSLRYQIPYNLLAQNIIANKDALFRNFADYKYKVPMKDYFEVYVGIDTPQNKFYNLEIKKVEKQIKKLEKNLGEEKASFKKREAEVLDALNSLRISKGLEILKSIKQAEEEEKLLGENSSYILMETDKSKLEGELNELKEIKKSLIEEKENYQTEKEEILKFDENYSNDEKRSVDLNLSKCPLCSQHSNEVADMIQEYNVSIQKYNVLSGQLSTFKSNELSQYLEECNQRIMEKVKEIKKIDEKITTVQKILYSGTDSTFWREYYKVKGQIPSFNNVQTLDELEKLKSDLNYYKERYKKTDRTGFMDKLNDNLTEIVRKFDIEDKFLDLKLKFDLDEFYLYFGDRKESGIGLSNTGSGGNWEAMHLALNISIIKTALEENQSKASIFPFLIVDQPTQVYFSSYDEMQNSKQELITNENKAVVKLFESLTDICNESGIQLIILEHIKPEHFEKMNIDLYKLLDDAKSEDWHSDNEALLEL